MPNQLIEAPNLNTKKKKKRERLIDITESP